MIVGARGIKYQRIDQIPDIMFVVFWTLAAIYFGINVSPVRDWSIVVLAAPEC